jgi:hypothetical protein
MTIRILQSDDEQCEACVAACRGCSVRFAALAPPRKRDEVFAAQPEADAPAFIADTRREYARLRALGRIQ